MDLKDKLIQIYPELTTADFSIRGGTIILRNDGQGQYIQTWEHPTLAKPTDEQLEAIK